MRMLLDRGAEPTADALRIAAASEGAPLDGIIRAARSRVRDEQALELASRHGDTPAAATLRKGWLQGRLGTCAVADAPGSAANRACRGHRQPAALQHADTVFLQRAGCISCHNNSLFLDDRRRGAPRGIPR
jgi:hypothetical protein